MIALAEIRAAAERIRGKVRRTPLIAAAPTQAALPGILSLKLENLQVTGSFKPRGAMNALAALGPEGMRRGLVTASGGNHGLAVAYAGEVGRVPTTIFLPTSAPAEKAEKLRAWGAGVRIEGAVWDDANRAALAHAAETGAAYIHPFADPAVIAGQGTVGLEILEEAPETDTIVVAIGGGGLVSGIALAAKAMKPSIRIIGVEPTGAPTLYKSVEAGAAVELASIATAAGTLAPRRSDPLNVDIIRANVERIVLVTDEEMRAAARRLWFEWGLAAELSGAAAFAAIAAGRYRPGADERACIVVCGAGKDGLD
jgi:threonine dehydratase